MNEGNKAGRAPASSSDDEVAQVHFQSVLTGSKHNGLEVPKSSYRHTENTQMSEWLPQSLPFPAHHLQFLKSYH